MVRHIALFVTLATVLHAVTTKTQLDTALVWAVFGAPPPPPPTAPTERQKFPPLCATPIGEIGDCVPRDHCTGDVKGAVTPGGDVTDTHGNHSKNNNDCPGYNQVCCPVYKRKQPHAVVDVQAVPVVKEEQNKEQESKSTCGTRVGEGGETPWLVIIKDPSKIWQSSDVYEGSVGGGALIHPSVVLTAAHVVYARLELQVLAGGADAQTREVDSVKVHELFNKHNAHNDIALVFLATPLDITPRARVACLPRAAAVATARCSATEWARSPHTGAGMVKTVDVPVVGHQECESKYRTTRLGPYFTLDKSFLCAGGEQRREVCRGDGGFPLMCPAEHTGRFVLFGVVAWDIECGQGAPTVHVDVAALRPWIDQEVASRGLATQSYTY